MTVRLPSWSTLKTPLNATEKVRRLSLADQAEAIGEGGYHRRLIIGVRGEVYFVKDVIEHVQSASVIDRRPVGLGLDLGGECSILVFGSVDGEMVVAIKGRARRRRGASPSGKTDTERRIHNRNVKADGAARLNLLGRNETAERCCKYG